MQSKTIKRIGSLGFIIIGFVFLLSTGRRIFQEEDFSSFLQWWLVLLVLGIGFLPMVMFVFRYFHDKGWIFSKAIGLAVSGWLMWYLASCRIMKFTVANCMLVCGICFAINIVFLIFVTLYYQKTGQVEKNPYRDITVDHALSAGVTELLFFAAFFIWTYLRCFKPEIMGNTEKFMDFGLMASVDNASYMPAEDMWLAGEGINYYYLGLYLSVFMKRLSGVALVNSYTLALMMIAGFAFSMPYSLMRQVVSDFRKKEVVRVKSSVKLEEERAGGWFAPVVGVISGFAVCFAGNMHYTIMSWIVVKVPALREAFSIDRDYYWFPDATRYIGYNPDTNDKTIHEFPSYSFVLGDLHPHVINIMFVITVMALLYTLLQFRRKRMDAYRFQIKDEIMIPEGRKMFLREVFQPQVIVIGFFIGFFHMTNYWDYPIYFVVSGAIILFSNAVLCDFKIKTLILTAAHAAVVLVVSAITALPFTLNFKQISTGIGICLNHTPLYQLAILWGLPITTVITFLIVLIEKMNRKNINLQQKKKIKIVKAVAASSLDGNTKFRREHPAFDWIFRFINSLEITDLFMITIGLCACGLILMPELVYVRDIYTGSYKRANTMFKLTYQAFIIFGMCMPYIAFRLIRFKEKLSQRIFGIVVLCLLVTTFGYFFKASESWFGDYRNPERYKGLDCTAFMKDYYPEDYEAVQWINESVEEPSVIVEGVGYSYTYYERISATTGHATIIGWETHEWLWRSEANFAKPDIITERQEEVKALYTSADAGKVKEITKKYDVDYILVGKSERFDGMTGTSEEKEGYTYNAADGRYYQPWEVNDELIRSLGEVVFQSLGADGSDKDENGEYRTYIVKINKGGL